MTPDTGDLAYNFAYLDEQTKRMIRRAILKGLAIPGYQVPFASREMPMPYGWGTGGVQVSAAVMTPEDRFKVIDQGADDTTNAVSIRTFFERTAGVETTTRTAEATVIQTRHRIPEQPLTEDQILVYQVPIPEPLRFLEPRETETRKMHALQDYGLMHVKLYEDISRHGHIATAYAYPVQVEGRYVMDPSPIPKFDNPKLEMAAIQLFGAGREREREGEGRELSIHHLGSFHSSERRTTTSRGAKTDGSVRASPAYDASAVRRQRATNVPRRLTTLRSRRMGRFRPDFGPPRSVLALLLSGDARGTARAACGT